MNANGGLRAVLLLGLALLLSHAAEDAERWQVTIGEGSDWPGATGMAYRFVDQIPARAIGGLDGGWIVGGWAQGGSGVARVAENGTVLYSHQLRFHGEPGRPNSQTVVRGVAAMVDSGCVVAGYTYHNNPGETRGFVLRLDEAGETVYSRIINHNGEALGMRINSVHRAADGGVMLMGSGPGALGTYSCKLDRSGLPMGGWVTDTDQSNHARDLIELPNGHFAYSGNAYVPNSAADGPEPADNGTARKARRQLQASNHWFVAELDATGRPVRRGQYGDTEWGHNTDIHYVDGPPGEEGFLLSGHLQTTAYETSKLVRNRPPSSVLHALTLYTNCRLIGDRGSYPGHAGLGGPAAGGVVPAPAGSAPVHQ